jgi:hypothetical protein
VRLYEFAYLADAKVIKFLAPDGLTTAEARSLVERYARENPPEVTVQYLNSREVVRETVVEVLDQGVSLVSDDRKKILDREAVNWLPESDR